MSEHSIADKQAKLDQQVERITALVNALSPTVDARGMPHITITVDGETSVQPLKGKRGSPHYARLYVASIYQERYHCKMPISAYNQAVDRLTLKAATQSSTPAPTPGALPTDDTPESNGYIRVQGSTSLFIKPGEAIVLIRTGRDGEERVTPLWDRAVPIVPRCYSIPGAMSGTELRIDLQIGRDRGIITYDDLKTGRWAAKFPGVAGVVDHRNHGQYANAISTLASLAPLTIGYERTGYYNLGDDLKRKGVYLYPDGRYIDGAGTVHQASDGGIELTNQVLTEQEQALWESHQIQTSSSIDDRTAAIEYLSALSKRKQPLMVLGHMAMALLYHVRNPHYGPGHTMALVGPPHSGKTATVGFTRCLVAPYRRKPALDATFEDTITDIEFALGDRASFPVVLDDLKQADYNTPGKRQEYIEKVDRVVRPTYNETPVRKRRNTKLQRVPSPVIRSCPTLTMEVLPDVSTSCLRRMFIVDIEQGEIKADTECEGDVALDQMPMHVAAINHLGYLLVTRVLRWIDARGIDALAARFQDYYNQNEKQLRSDVQALWKERKPGEVMPDEAGSVIENAAYDLLGLFLLDQVAGCSVKMEQEAYPHIIEMVYQNIVRIAGSSADDDGYTAIDHAMLTIFESIGDAKNHDGQVWQVERYTPTDRFIKPEAFNEQGECFPGAQWGYTAQTANEKTLTTVYFDQDVTYITGEFRHALQSVLNSRDDCNRVTSDKALSQLLDKQCWLVRLNTRGCSRDIYPHGKRIGRVLALDNRKLFPLLGIASIDKPLTLPGNVTPFPSPSNVPVARSIDESSPVAENTELETIFAKL